MVADSRSVLAGRHRIDRGQGSERHAYIERRHRGVAACGPVALCLGARPSGRGCRWLDRLRPGRSGRSVRRSHAGFRERPRVDHSRRAGSRRGRGQGPSAAAGGSVSPGPRAPLERHRIAPRSGRPAVGDARTKRISVRRLSRCHCADGQAMFSGTGRRPGGGGSSLGCADGAGGVSFNGSVAEMRVPRPGTLSTTSDPPRAASRSRMPRMPWALGRVSSARKPMP